MAIVKEQLSALGECEGEVDAMLDDMGVGEEGTEEALEMRTAVKAFIIKDFKIHVELNGIDEPYPVSELEDKAEAFWEGYEACLEKHR